MTQNMSVLNLPVLNNVLCEYNAHPRDKRIQFFENTHTYIIDAEPTVKYTSVTTWIHEHFEKFDADLVIAKMMRGIGWKKGHKYWGMTPEEIKSMWDVNKNAVSSEGTNLHYKIECFHNNANIPIHYTNEQLFNEYSKGITNDVIEWQYFINFIKDHPHLKPYRTEWTVFNEDVKISGSIDMVYENPDGTLSIYDWKRSKNITMVNNFNKFALNPCISHLPDANFWHYTLQLNTYKYILETKYGKTIKDLYLVRLHPTAIEKNYELMEVPFLATEMNDLLQERINNM